MSVIEPLDPKGTSSNVLLRDDSLLGFEGKKIYVTMSFVAVPARASVSTGANFSLCSTSIFSTMKDIWHQLKNKPREGV